jgi:competence protein ComGC
MIKNLKDEAGFSTTLDIFLFLVMISISAVILLPSITGNTQIKSVVETKNQKMSGEVLLTLLNGRVDEFEYTVAGDQMDAIAGEFNNSSIYITTKKLFAGHEIKHKTFADLAAEDAASQWVIYSGGKRLQLNFLMTNYSDSLTGTLGNYLDKQIGDRYDYNFSVVWRPVVNVPVGSDLHIGQPVPKKAYIESTYITMPYHVNFTRKRVEGIIDRKFNTTFGNLSTTFEELKKNGTNRSQVEEAIYSGIFDSINETVDEAVADLVDETLGAVLDNAQGTMIQQVDNSLPESNVLLSQTVKARINETLTDESANIQGTMSEKLTFYFQNVTKDELQRISGTEIRSLSTELADLYVNGVITIDGARDRILTEIFSRISISRAQVSLAVWEKKK